MINPPFISGRGRAPTLLLGAIVLLVFGCFAASASAEDRQSQVKAAYLQNFAKYIEWPASTFEVTPATFYICVPADDPIAEVISGQQGKSVKGMNVEWRVYESFDSVKECQVLFIPDRRRLSLAIKATASRPVLLVGEQDGFLQAGGGIVLVPAEGRIAFEINLKALQQVDLKAGAQLLKVAREVIR